jgi:hypothetical protein
MEFGGGGKGLGSWWFWYNSPDQKLQRCITAEGQQWETKVQTDPQAALGDGAGCGGQNSSSSSMNSVGS